MRPFWSAIARRTVQVLPSWPLPAACPRDRPSRKHRTRPRNGRTGRCHRPRVRRVFIFPHSHMPQGPGIVCAHRQICNLQEQGAPTCLATPAALSRHERVHARPASIGNGTSTGHRSTRPGMVVSFRASGLFRGRQTHARISTALRREFCAECWGSAPQGRTSAMVQLRLRR